MNGHDLVYVSQAPVAPLFDSFEPDEQQVREFVRLHGQDFDGLSPEGRAEALTSIKRYVLTPFQCGFPPEVVSYVLDLALFQVTEKLKREHVVSPTRLLVRYMMSGVPELDRDFLEIQTTRALAERRLRAELSGELPLPAPSTLEREIARLKAEPLKWSGIGDLKQDEIAAIAEEFVHLPPHATAVTVRDVLAAFRRYANRTVRTSELNGERRPASVEQIQKWARRDLLHVAYGPPEHQLGGRTTAGGTYSHRSDYAAVPQEIVDEALARHPELRGRGNPPDDWRSPAYRLSEVLWKCAAQFGPAGYGCGLQDEADAALREKAEEACQRLIAEYADEERRRQEQRRQMADWRRAHAQGASYEAGDGEA